MLKVILKFHVLPFSVALFITLFFFQIFPFNYWLELDPKENLQVKEPKEAFLRGNLPNLVDSVSLEANFYGSLKRDEQITVFGSSELNKTPFAPYFLLPDSFGIPCFALGHAHHQSLGILGELLPFNGDLSNSKICVIVSLTWFKTDGTNSEAFIEFLRPNFLNRIVKDQDLDEKYLALLGDFLVSRQSEIDGLSSEMDMLTNFSKSNGDLIKYLMRHWGKKINSYIITPNVDYIYKNSTLNRKEKLLPLDDWKVAAQAEFVSRATNNNLWVDDEYYSNYLIREDGSQITGEVGKVDLSGNEEWQDFKYLVSYLKENNTNASFILQPINPCFYEDIEGYDALSDSISALLNSNQFPFLNMHVSDTANYEVGTLKDIMHLGDYGWLKIDEFLLETYE